MAGKTVLERKIDWWYRNIDKDMSSSDFELVKMSGFDENGSLIFKDKIRFYDIIKLVKRLNRDVPIEPYEPKSPKSKEM